MKKLKKLLIMSYDPDFSQKVFELTKSAEVEILLANGLSEGENLMAKESISGIIIEYSAGSDPTVLSGFLSRQNIRQVPTLLAAKENRFLSDFNGENILKYGFDEIDIGIQKLMER